MMKHVPNILTGIRFGLIPLFIYCFYSGRPSAHLEALVVFLIAGITDVLDGYIARRFDLITPLGTVLDPLADKLMLVSALLCLYLEAHLPMVVLLIVIIKEIVMIFAASLLYYKKEKTVLPANRLGKAATLLFFIAIILILSELPSPLTNSVLTLAVLMKIIAFIGYISLYIRLKKRID